MSILRVANLQFNASGTRRIDYDAVADDGIIKVSAAAVKLPVGDNASRPASQAGIVRYNSDTGYMEFGGATSWIPVASNSAFDVANAAFASANNVAPQVTPAFLTANLAYTTTNTAYGFANSAYASINSNWTVTNTIYGIANSAYASINSNWTVTNTIYGIANTALQNTNVTLAGSLTATGSITSGGTLQALTTVQSSSGADLSLNANGSNRDIILKVNAIELARLVGSTGNFGIGKTPSYALDVNGTINATAITGASMPSGSWVLLNTLTASSSAALQDITNITSSYTHYAFVINRLLPATNSVHLYMRYYVSGAFQTAASYWWVGTGSNNGTAAFSVGNMADSIIRIGNNNGINSAYDGLSSVMYLINPSSTGYKMCYGIGGFIDGNPQTTSLWFNATYRGSTAPVTGVQFYMSSGNIASGTIQIYGIK